jgi:hypothetical protein
MVKSKKLNMGILKSKMPTLQMFRFSKCLLADFIKSGVPSTNYTSGNHGGFLQVYDALQTPPSKFSQCFTYLY